MARRIRVLSGPQDGQGFKTFPLCSRREGTGEGEGRAIVRQICRRNRALLELLTPHPDPPPAGRREGLPIEGREFRDQVRALHP
jgi:hypothetical protein